MILKHDDTVANIFIRCAMDTEVLMKEEDLDMSSALEVAFGVACAALTVYFHAVRTPIIHH